MSTIVAVRKGGQAAVAWDSGAVTASIASPHSVSRSKVQRFGDNLIGVAGFTVYCNILAECFRESPPANLTDESAVFRFFLQFWRDLHERFHFTDDHSDRDSPSPFADLDSEFMVVNASGIYHIREVLSVSRFDEFCAIGSGASHAEGAVSVLLSYEPYAKAIAERAVEIACQFDTRSCGRTMSLTLEKLDGGGA
ncbi:MAG: hypothetical protein Q7R41_11415 [Phycisphaerales bacterium]|nr:hypothetical protein [Phycisphaerales bacterium]